MNLINFAFTELSVTVEFLKVKYTMQYGIRNQARNIKFYDWSLSTTRRQVQSGDQLILNILSLWKLLIDF